MERLHQRHGGRRNPASRRSGAESPAQGQKEIFRRHRLRHHPSHRGGGRLDMLEAGPASILNPILTFYCQKQ